MESVHIIQFKCTSEEFRKIIREEVENALRTNNPLPKEEDIIGIEDAMRITRLKRQTIYCLITAKEIPYIKVPGRKKLLFSKQRLLDWINTGRKRTAKEIIKESQHHNIK